MDPVSLLLGAMVFAGFLVKLVQDGRTDRTYAAKGIVSPRHQVRLARLKQAGIAEPKTKGGPLRDYLAALWADAWLDALERRQVKRAARPPYTYDPDRPRWHARVDTAVLRGIDRLRSRYGAPAPPEPEPAADEHLADPVEYEPGTWTLDEKGKKVPLGTAVVQPAATASAEPVDAPTTDSTCQDPQCLIHRPGKPTKHEGEDMTTSTTTTGTPTAAAATEVNTNEDARREFTAMHEAANKAADALAALEAAREEIAAAAAGLTDGMSAKKFDQGATAAANEAVDAINLGQVAHLSELVDTVQAAAAQGLTQLDKYRDAEEQVAAEDVDATTLATTGA